MKIWILLLCANVFSSDLYTHEVVTGTDVRQAEERKTTLVWKTIEFVLQTIGLFVLGTAFSIHDGFFQYPNMLQTHATTIATCVAFLIIWKPLDGISRRLPVMRGKTLLVLVIKLLIFFYMFQIIFNVIDANFFYMYNNKEINGLKYPMWESEDLVIKAQEYYEACWKMQTNRHHRNPQIERFVVQPCRYYRDRDLLNEFHHRNNYFPNKGDNYNDEICDLSYKACAFRNHPDQGGTTTKLKLCSALLGQCLGRPLFGVSLSDYFDSIIYD